MKKLLLTAIAASLAAVSYGQGTVLINNLYNTGVYLGNGGTTANPVYSALVTQNGLIFTTDPTETEAAVSGSGSSALIGADFSWGLYGGSSASTLTLIESATGSAASGDNQNWGQFLGDSTAASIAGTTAGSTIYLELYVWEGTTFTSYAAALAGGDYTGVSGVFSETSGGGANPEVPTLTSMPDVLLTVPEPGTMALAALGGASLLLFRRKK